MILYSALKRAETPYFPFLSSSHLSLRLFSAAVFGSELLFLDFQEERRKGGGDLSLNTFFPITRSASEDGKKKSAKNRTPPQRFPFSHFAIPFSPVLI